LSLQVSEDDTDPYAFPEIPWLKHLQIVHVRRQHRRDDVVVPWRQVRFDLAALLDLRTLYLRNVATLQHLTAFKGKSQLDQCIFDVSAGKMTFNQENTKEFFSLMATSLKSLIIGDGDALRRSDNPTGPRATYEFMNLIALKVAVVPGSAGDAIFRCPKLERMWIYFKDHRWMNLTDCEIFNMHLHDTKNIRTLVLQTSDIKELDATVFDTLRWCRQLQHILLEGPVFASENAANYFGTSHPELDVVMAIHDDEQISQVCCVLKNGQRFRDGQLTNEFKRGYQNRLVPGLHRPPHNFRVQVSSRVTWNSHSCICGRRDKHAFLRYADPEGYLSKPEWNEEQCQCPDWTRDTIKLPRHGLRSMGSSWGWENKRKIGVAPVEQMAKDQVHHAFISTDFMNNHNGDGRTRQKRTKSR
jgi:hypothetical protein